MTQREKQNIKVTATYTDGLYRVLFTRSLRTGDKNNTVFEAGKFTPFQVTLYDGRNGEENKKGAIFAWYYLVLEPPTPASVYILPVVSYSLFLALGLMLHTIVRKKGQAR